MFKNGEYVVALEEHHYVTKDKIYQIEEVFKDEEEYLLFLEVDEGIKQWYDASDFISLLEYRKQKINKIKERICTK